jgi:Binding-protein-dependent transport system inner membrane component/NMT1/THI5 like
VIRYQVWPGTVLWQELGNDLGYLHKIQLKWVGSTTSGTQDIQSVATNQVGVGQAFNGAVVKLVGAKSKVESVVTYYGADAVEPNAAYVVLADGPIRGPGDWIGKSIALNAMRAHGEMVLREWLSREGGPDEPTPEVRRVLPESAVVPEEEQELLAGSSSEPASAEPVAGPRISASQLLAKTFRLSAGVVALLVLWQFAPQVGLALLPVFLLVLDMGETSKVSLVFYAGVFPVVLGTIAGVRSTDPLLVKAARARGIGHVALFAKVVLPGAVPSVFTGIRQADSASIAVLIVAEMVGARAGLGYSSPPRRRVSRFPTCISASSPLPCSRSW